MASRERELEQQRVIYIKSDLYPKGEFVSELDARLSVFDRGFSVGVAAYEYARTYQHKPFQVKEHMDRIFASLKVLRINPGFSHVEFCGLCENVTMRNIPLLEEYEEYNIVWEVTRGDWGWHGRRPPIPDEAGLPTIIVKNNLNDQNACAWTYYTGLHLVTPLSNHVGPQGWDPKMKTYRNYVLASLETRLVDAHATALMVDENGNLTEATGGNVWLVSDGQLMTPTDRNILRGQTRANVMTLAKKLDIPVVEKDLQPWHLYNCDEAFHSSTYPGPLMPVGQFNGVLVGKELPGPITERLADAWSEWVGIDVTGLNRLTDGERTKLENERDKLNKERTELVHISY